MAEKLIHLPIEEARAAKWRRGREQYGPVFIGHPLEELHEELLDAINYAEEARQGFPMAGIPEDLRDLCESIRAIYRAAAGKGGEGPDTSARRIDQAPAMYVFPHIGKRGRKKFKGAERGTPMKKTKQDEAIMIPDPPGHLSERARELWRKLAPNKAKSVERRTLFQAGLEALDRADEARRIIQAEGMISKTTTTGALHVHPAVKVEREARAQFVRIWDLLNLGWNSDVDGRHGW